MRTPAVKVIKESLIDFLCEATQNQSQFKYVMFNYLHGTIFGIVLWNYVIHELCFFVDPFWMLYFQVIAFGIQINCHNKNDTNSTGNIDRSCSFLITKTRSVESVLYVLILLNIKTLI